METNRLEAAAAAQEQRAQTATTAKAVELLVAAMQARLVAMDLKRAAH